MTAGGETIAGFGFCTDEALPDLDDQLARIHWAELDGCAATARRFMELVNRAEPRAA